MTNFGHFYLDKEKDIIVDLHMEGETLSYVLRTPNHKSGNLITNLAGLCGLPLSFDEKGLKVVRGEIPCYIDGANKAVYILRLGDTKVANIYPDGTIERKASIPAIAKTLMSQTRKYGLGTWETLVKTYIPREYKFRTDLHTHMNANLDPDILIALGIHHQIRYPLYYIRKLQLRCTPAQEELLAGRRAVTAERFADSPLQGKYLTRRINDNTFINFADFILADPDNAAYNIPRIRASLTILKDGQAVFSNLEKVYLYRTPEYKSAQRIGSGTVNRTGALAVKGTGSILKMHVKDGETVERGQLLFETVEGDIDALVMLDDTIRSTLNGVVAEMKVSAGQKVSKGDVLLTAYRTEDYQVRFSIPEEELSNVNVGDSASLYFSWNEDKSEPFAGTVTEVSYVSEETDGEVAYSGYIAFAADDTVRLGMNVSVVVE